MTGMTPVPDIEKYVDVEDALKRVCGNKAIYKRLLGTFEKSLQLNQLVAEVAEGDLQAAAATAHSIKGVTANLSLKAAYEKVVEVEAHLKQGFVEDGEMDALREILETTVRCTQHVIETL